MWLDNFLSYVQSLDWVPPALTGGLVDYLSKVRADRRKCSFFDSIAHAVSAMFFGWLAGKTSIAAGFVRIDPVMTASQVSEVLAAYTVAVALGGFYGNRIGDVILFAVKRKAGMNDQ